MTRPNTDVTQQKQHQHQVIIMSNETLITIIPLPHGIAKEQSFTEEDFFTKVLPHLNSRVNFPFALNIQTAGNVMPALTKQRRIRLLHTMESNYFLCDLLLNNKMCDKNVYDGFIQICARNHAVSQQATDSNYYARARELNIDSAFPTPLNDDNFHLVFSKGGWWLTYRERKKIITVATAKLAAINALLRNRTLLDIKNNDALKQQLLTSIIRYTALREPINKIQAKVNSTARSVKASSFVIATTIAVLIWGSLIATALTFFIPPALAVAFVAPVISLPLFAAPAVIAALTLPIAIVCGVLAYTLDMQPCWNNVKKIKHHLLQLQKGERVGEKKETLWRKINKYGFSLGNDVFSGSLIGFSIIGWVSLPLPFLDFISSSVAALCLGSICGLAGIKKDEGMQMLDELEQETLNIDKAQQSIEQKLADMELTADEKICVDEIRAQQETLSKQKEKLKLFVALKSLIIGAVCTATIFFILLPIIAPAVTAVLSLTAAFLPVMPAAVPTIITAVTLLAGLASVVVGLAVANIIYNAEMDGINAVEKRNKDIVDDSITSLKRGIIPNLINATLATTLTVATKVTNSSIVTKATNKLRAIVSHPLFSNVFIGVAALILIPPLAPSLPLLVVAAIGTVAIAGTLSLLSAPITIWKNKQGSLGRTAKAQINNLLHSRDKSRENINRIKGRTPTEKITPTITPHPYKTNGTTILDYNKPHDPHHNTHGDKTHTPRI